jgi:hypothetical protein
MANKYNHDVHGGSDSDKGRAPVGKRSSPSTRFPQASHNNVGGFNKSASKGDIFPKTGKAGS